MDVVPTQRPRSIRSVSSNSSMGSGVSLSRRPRITRSRSRTVIGGPPTPAEVPNVLSTPHDLPYLSSSVGRGSMENNANGLKDPMTRQSDPLLRGPRSQQRLDIRSSGTASSQEVFDPDPTVVAVELPGTQSKATKQGANLPLLDTGYKPPPSAFSRNPALTPTVNVRDSVSTQQSGFSSSIYPPSTSATPATDSPTSPISIAGQLDPAPLNLEVKEVQDYDGDDVAYRLRLLVKNNYFLPPAHSKPSPADLASPDMNSAKKSPRSAGPAFLDIFRVGKSKSKPTTPTTTTAGIDPTALMLRATADSITPPLVPRKKQSYPVQASPFVSNPTPRGRVVVVREKMNDIAVAAKQAEQDLKTRAVKIEQGSHKTNPIVVVDDVVDPTDAVDIPLPSPSYPFAIQASALHGLGVMESLGANVLDERLVPSKNPNLPTSYDRVEDSWRKNLLHQAVYHSLDNTPDVSTFSYPHHSSTPLDTPKAQTIRTSESISANLTKVLIQQKISTRRDTTPTPKLDRSRQKSLESTKSANIKSLTIPTGETSMDRSRPGSVLPQRVETPSGPMTPLAPPPRRFLVNPLHSLSQDDLTSTQSSYSSVGHEVSDHRLSLRRTVSSPMLVERHELPRQRLVSPPPMPPYIRYSRGSSFDTVGHTLENNEDMFSDGAVSPERRPRHSLALSAVRSRPSMSEYSQPSASPTTSAFQDFLNRDERSTSSVDAGPSRYSVEDPEAYRSGRSSRSAMSPPPRQSSSIAHAALPPPPRTSSLNYTKTHPQLRNLQLAQSNFTTTKVEIERETTLHIPAPEPTTPPLPGGGSEGPSTSQTVRLNAITISSTQPSPVVHSAPGPSSPTSFFDSIQSQPNAMDDLDSSDESGDEANATIPRPPQVFVDQRSRAASSSSNANNTPRSQIMRLGNLSTPQFRAGENRSREDLRPLESDARFKKPVANNPIKPSKDNPPSSYDFYKYAQEHPLNFPALSGASSSSSNPRRPATADHVTTWRNDQKKQESLRKLDGMLLQHIEDEKDIIKRIASHLKQTAHSQQPRSPNI